MNIRDEWPALQCGQCKFFKVDADRTASTCKRIDHKTIKFAVPWFKSYDCGQFAGTVCKDFEPSPYIPWLWYHWQGWENYWQGDEPKGLIYFTLNGDTSIRYGVDRKDFNEGTMYDENGNLKWIERMYYKQSRSSPTGYKLIREKRKGGE